MKLNRVSAAAAAAAIAPAVLLSSPAFAADGHKASAVSAPDAASEAQKGDAQTSAEKENAQNGEAPKDSASSSKSAKADENNRFAILKIINKSKPGSRVYEAAQEAMNGSAEDRVRFLKGGYELAQFADDMVRTVQISSIGGKAVRKAALEALRKDTHEALRQFLEVGQYVARDEDNRVEIARILHTAKRGSVLFDAAQEALDGSPEARTRFLEVGQHAARATDDRIRATRIFSAGGPHVREAAKKALRSGKAEDVRHFLEVGQYEARKLDEAEDAKAKNNKDSKGDENSQGRQESKGGKATDGAKQKQDGAMDAKKSNGTTDAKPAVATSGTGSSRAQLASTGAGSATPWAIGGTAAALTVGAGLVIASRRRTAFEH